MKMFPNPQIFGLLMAGVLIVNLTADAQTYVTNAVNIQGEFVTNVATANQQSFSPQALVASKATQSSIAPTFRTNVENVAGTIVTTVVVDDIQAQPANTVSTSRAGLNVLAIEVAAPKLSKNIAVVELTMKNNLGEKIQSARAVAFLLDEKGQMIGQSTKWVIGGTKEIPGLPAGGTNTYNFVITSDKPFTTTNLTAKVNFTRVLLENGKLADVTKDVQIVLVPK